MLLQRLRPLLLPIVYLAATYQFIRYYVSFPYFYLRLPAYFSGRERLPFQLRVLPILVLKPLGASRLIRHIAAGRTGPLHNPDRLAFAILSFITFSIAFYFSMKLYRALSPSGRLHFLVFPVLLSVAVWTYVIHIEQDFSYPYDMPSLAFFTAGIFCIYRRRFLPLALIVFVGTFNRETTLFLIGIYILEMASLPSPAPAASFRQRFLWSQIPWPRVALLTLLWTAVKVSLFFAFRYNDHSEDHSRILENFIRLLSPNYWPSALNLCGYLLPFVLLYRSRIRPQRFANYLYILAPWIAIMFISGILLETRLYGELSGFIAVSMVLICEQYLETSAHRHPTETGNLAPGLPHDLPTPI